MTIVQWCGNSAKEPGRHENYPPEHLIEMLKKYPLHPIFEWFGGFVNEHPQWLSAETEAQYKGLTLISGNFMHISYSFRILTDDVDFIAKVKQLVTKNRKFPAYQKALDQWELDYSLHYLAPSERFIYNKINRQLDKAE